MPTASGRTQIVLEVLKMKPEISLEIPNQELAIEELCAEAFGPGRFTRSAFRLREDVESEPDLSFVVHINGDLIGSVKLTRILVGNAPVLLLGPLVVAPAHKNTGIGKLLMEHSVNTARAKGHDAILLVGDLPYYERFGFKQIERGKVTLPGPADPDRILMCSLGAKPVEEYTGKARKLS